MTLDCFLQSLCSLFSVISFIFRPVRFPVPVSISYGRRGRAPAVAQSLFTEPVQAPASSLIRFFSFTVPAHPAASPSTTIMAPPSSFQLFPSSVPRIAVPDPRRKRQPSLSNDAVICMDTLAHMPNTVAAVIELTTQTSDHHDQHRHDAGRSRSPTPETQPQVVPMSTTDGKTPSPINSQHSAHNCSPSGSHELKDKPATVSASPLPPPPPLSHRSMFPVYNPCIPLNQQSYYPQLPFPKRMATLQRQTISRQEYSNRMSTPTRFDDAVGGVRTAPASVVNFPPDVLSLRENRYSSQRELEKLWDASHGMDTNHGIGSFNLEMARYVSNSIPPRGSAADCKAG